MSEVKKEWAEVEACIYESDKDYKMYFKLYSDDNKAVRQIKSTKQLLHPTIVIDKDEEGNIIGVEVLAYK